MVSNRKARLIVLAALMRREMFRLFVGRDAKINNVDVRVWYGKKS